MVLKARSLHLEQTAIGLCCCTGFKPAITSTYRTCKSIGCAWQCYGLGLAKSGMASVIFIDDLKYDDGSRSQSTEVEKHSVCQCTEKCIKFNCQERCHAARQCHETDCQQNTDFIREKLNFLDWPSQSAVVNPIEHAFHVLKGNGMTETITPRSCGMSMVKNHKGRIHQFGDATGSLA